MPSGNDYYAEYGSGIVDAATRYRTAASSIHLVRDNAGGYFIIDLQNWKRVRVGGPGSGSFRAAVALYGAPKTTASELGAEYQTFRDQFLTNIGRDAASDGLIYLDGRIGFTDHGSAVDFFGGPNQMERVVAGEIPDPFTGQMFANPTYIRAGDGTEFGLQHRTPEEDPNGPARAILQDLLSQYGLEGLIPDVDRWLLEGLSPDEIRIELRKTEEYKQRFPGIVAMQDNNLKPPSEAEYLELEKGYARVLRAYGLPEGFYDDPNDFAAFISGNVSVSELEERVVDGVVAAQQAPQEVRDALSQFYGIPNATGALAAYYLDPERSLPEIERQFRAASIAGRAQMTTFGELEQADAERLAALGITDAQAQQGFTNLVRNAQNFSALAGEVGGVNISEDEQLAAQFEGDVGAQELIRRQSERRAAAFQGSDAGAATSREGLTGLRSASA